MNIKGMLKKFRGNTNAELVETPPKVTENQASSLGVTHPDPGSNVVKLPVKLQKIDHSSSGSIEYPPMPGLASEPARSRIKGLMNSQELEAFFQDNHFGLGRHNGANYRSQEAFQLGKRTIISRFHNIIEDLISRRQEKMNKLKLEMIAIEGISTTMSMQLQLACEQLQRDIAALEKQIDLSNKEQGWILDALNRFHIGFSKGLREALEFDLLAQ
jgi:hypothetical protein